MYHPDVIAHRIDSTERKFGFRLHRYSPDESRYISSKLELKRNPKSNLLVDLSEDEQLFVQNEILMSRCSFPYWVERSCTIIADSKTGVRTPLKLWRAQQLLVDRVAAVEKEMWDLFQSGERERFDGNCHYIHKSGQRGLSTVCQAIGIHRTNFWSDMSGLAASTNDVKTNELWQNYGYMMYTGMPDWMRTPTVSDTRKSGLQFVNGSKVVLQFFEQNSGLGQGAKWHWAHLTECAQWSPNDKVVDQIENHFMPRVSRSIKGMAFLESTSQGTDDWWHTTTELARRGEMNRWRYFFVPWYLTLDISIDYPPDGWQPAEHTRRETELIERTSVDWNGGWPVRLSLEQQYYWERERANYERKGTLGEFYKNYPSTPEQSFMPGGRCSFPYEILTHCEQGTREPLAYYDIVHMDGVQTVPNELVYEEYIDYTGYKWKPHTVGTVTIAPVRTTVNDRQKPLGLIRLWDRVEDLRRSNTFASVDSASGLPNWSRLLQRPDDKSLDFASVNIVRHVPAMDVQSVLLTAPLTPKTLAKYFNVMCRWLYGANAVDQQIPTVVELCPYGRTFQEELVTTYDWYNFYQHYVFRDGEYVETTDYGWKPGGVATRMMWVSGKQRICDRKVIVRAITTVNEMRNCQDEQIRIADMVRGKTKENSGRHDDEIYSLMIGLWYANDWAHNPSGLQPGQAAGKSVYELQLPVDGSQPVMDLQMMDLLPEQRELYKTEQWQRFLDKAEEWR